MVRVGGRLGFKGLGSIKFHLIAHHIFSNVYLTLDVLLKLEQGIYVSCHCPLIRLKAIVSLIFFILIISLSSN